MVHSALLPVVAGERVTCWWRRVVPTSHVGVEESVPRMVNVTVPVGVSVVVRDGGGEDDGLARVGRRRGRHGRRGGLRGCSRRGHNQHQPGHDQHRREASHSKCPSPHRGPLLHKRRHLLLIASRTDVDPATGIANGIRHTDPRPKAAPMTAVTSTMKRSAEGWARREPPWCPVHLNLRCCSRIGRGLSHRCPHAPLDMDGRSLGGLPLPAVPLDDVVDESGVERLVTAVDGLVDRPIGEEDLRVGDGQVSALQLHACRPGCLRHTGARRRRTRTGPRSCSLPVPLRATKMAVPAWGAVIVQCSTVMLKVAGRLPAPPLAKKITPPEARQPSITTLLRAFVYWSASTSKVSDPMFSRMTSSTSAPETDANAVPGARPHRW